MFGQLGNTNAFTATNNGATGIAGGTTLSAVDIKVVIDAIAAAAPSPPFVAYLNLQGVSDSNVVMDALGHLTQNFDVNFKITSLAGGAGVNYLSGQFDDSVFGNGTGLTMTATGLPISAFTSDVIGVLGQPRAVSMSFTDVSPAVQVTNDSLSSFTSSISGTFSAVPEPTSMALLGIGIAWHLAFRRRAANGRRLTTSDSPRRLRPLGRPANPSIGSHALAHRPALRRADEPFSIGYCEKGLRP